MYFLFIWIFFQRTTFSKDCNETKVKEAASKQNQWQNCKEMKLRKEKVESKIKIEPHFFSFHANMEINIEN